MAFFFSCEKENIDVVEVEEEEVVPEVIECNLEVTLSGNLDGSYAANTTGGTPPFTFLWSTQDTTNSITLDSSGLYSVTVTDADGCIASEESQLLVPGDCDIYVILINGDTICIMDPGSVLCVDSDFTVNITESSPGILSAVTNGGVEPFSYLWTNGETTPSISINQPGEYFVVVTGADGCIRMDNFDTESSDDCENFSVSISPEVVTPSTSSIDLNIDNGTPPYLYQWSTGEIGPIIVPTVDDIYFVTVTDANGCTDLASFEYQECGDLELVLNIDVNNPEVATAVVMGGLPPYRFEWSHGFTTQTAPILESGTYTITVTDANNCSIVSSFEIEIPPADLCEDLIIDILETSEIDQLGVSTSGGSGNYSYLWNSSESINTINVFESGDYSLTITDLDFGCTKEVELVYALSDNCNDFAGKLIESSPGTLKIKACGGALPYIYEWPNGNTGDELTNLASGLYLITITDANSCNLILSHVVE